MFTPMHKGTPVHVKAAWIYNDLLKYHKLENYEKIKNSEKIRWVYLKDNTLQIKQIAFKGYDDPPEIMEFIQKNVTTSFNSAAPLWHSFLGLMGAKRVKKSASARNVSKKSEK